MSNYFTDAAGDFDFAQTAKSLFNSAKTGLSNLDGKDYTAMLGAGLDYYAKDQALDYNKQLSQQNAAWQNKLLGIQQADKAEATANIQATEDIWSSGFNRGKGLGGMVWDPKTQRYIKAPTQAAPAIGGGLGTTPIGA